MQIVLVGAVESTRIALESLVECGIPPAALFTLPLAKANRHSDFVHLAPLAARAGVQVVEVSNINSTNALEQIRSFEPDLTFVIGWSQICRDPFLRIPRLGCVGYHPALLPENRGRAVIPWTILLRKRETGSTLFWLDPGVDSGDILVQEPIAVTEDETAQSLYDKHLDALGRLLRRAVSQFRSGEVSRLPQDHTRATYCAKRTPADGLIEWNLPAEAVWTLIRAVGAPYPGAFSFWRGRKLIVWQADLVGPGPYWGLPGQIQSLQDGGALVQCGDGNHVLLRTVQILGEQPLPADQVLGRHEKLGIDLADLYDRLIREWNR